jgi:hypothetical protein
MKEITLDPQVQEILKKYYTQYQEARKRIQEIIDLVVDTYGEPGVTYVLSSDLTKLVAKDETKENANG